MKKLTTLWLLIFLINIGFSQNSRYKGLRNTDKFLDPYKHMVKPKNRIRLNNAMRLSLEKSINQYSLLEYCFVLEFLLEAMENNQEKQKQWVVYTDSLANYASKVHSKSGLIGLESEYFLATLKLNKDLFTDKYPNSYKFLLESTPNLAKYSYKKEDYEKILLEIGFSEIVGEGIITEMILLEGPKLLDIIRKNHRLNKRFNSWINYTVPDRSFAFEYSDLRGAELMIRKANYLELIFLRDKNQASKYIARQFSRIMVVRPNKTAPNAKVRVLNGVWQGEYSGNKILQLHLSYSDAENPEEKVVGYSKFSHQGDDKQIKFEGNYKEDKSHIYLTLNELPKTKAKNGVFTLIIEIETRNIEGKWESYDGSLKRDFTMKKLSEDEDW